MSIFRTIRVNFRNKNLTGFKTIYFISKLFLKGIFQIFFFEDNFLISDISHKKTFPGSFLNDIFQVVLDIFKMNFLVLHTSCVSLFPKLISGGYIPNSFPLFWKQLFQFEIFYTRHYSLNRFSRAYSKRFSNNFQFCTLLKFP